jgi:hypothetical protein
VCNLEELRIQERGIDGGKTWEEGEFMDWVRA